jgi:hypothetical protein
MHQSQTLVYLTTLSFFLARRDANPETDVAESIKAKDPDEPGSPHTAYVAQMKNGADTR